MRVLWLKYQETVVQHSAAIYNANLYLNTDALPSALPAEQTLCCSGSQCHLMRPVWGFT